MSAAKEKKRIDEDGGGKLLASPVVKEREREKEVHMNFFAIANLNFSSQ